MKKSKEELIKSLNSASESERMYAADDIQDSGYSELSLDVIRRFRTEKSAAVKNAMLSALQKMEYAEAYPEIFACFSEKDPYIRNSAVSIFSSYGNNAVIFLSSYINHSNKEVRKLILDSLVEIAGSHPDTLNTIIIILRSYLHDPEINVVITAVEYLSRLGDTGSAEDIINLYIKNQELMLRSSILDFFLKIGTKEDLEKILTAAFLSDSSKVNSLFLPQIIRLLGKSGRKTEYLNLILGLHDVLNYSDDILISMDWLSEETDFNTEEALPVLKKISGKAGLKDDMKILCVQLILKSGEAEAVEFVREWSERGTEDFRSFCSDSIKSVIKNG